MTYWLSSYSERKKTKTKWKIEGSLILICIKLNLFVWLMDEKIFWIFLIILVDEPKNILNCFEWSAIILNCLEFGSWILIDYYVI